MTMSVRQRLLTALALKEPDRLPITLYGVYPYSRDHVFWSRPSYRPLLDFARENIDPLGGWGTWNVEQGHFYARVAVCTRTLESEAVVERTVQTSRGPLRCITRTTPTATWTTKHFCQDQDDIQRFMSIGYEPVYPDLTPALDVERNVGERALMFHNCISDPLDIVARLFSPEDFAIRCITETATIKKMLEKMFEHIYDYLHYVLDHGPRSLYIIAGPEFATAPLLAPRYFDEFVTPFDSRLIDLIHSHGSWATISCNGRLDGVLERIADMGPTALMSIEPPPMGDVSLAEVKRRVGDRLCLIGNIQSWEMLALTREEIDARVRQAVKDGAPGGGFILATCGSPLEERLSPSVLANYVHLVESACKG